ncbi:SDR family oxidoreductase [Baekduia soli]|uniref:SDR family oxidoreductase n=1 Tax=Baekduia soli TaxID=496014 RepID=A0A5B8U057_9ACTN|nr:SDR family oxidoreductase [Baekduia soli]QEC46356.1 SDR family oxidoreductase [Baekduia soli]
MSPHPDQAAPAAVRAIRDRHAGRRALVTGAGSGIGRAIARRLAAEGASVACLDVDRRAAGETAAAIEAAGGTPLVVVADVRRGVEVRAAVGQAIADLGGLDLLVNAAGIVTMSGFDDVTEDEWDRVVDVNMKGYFLVAKAAVEALAVGNNPAMVNITTIEAEVIVSTTGRCQVHYNASKGGALMLTKALAAELARRGIRVNAVAPGATNTLFTGTSFADPDVFAVISDRLLIKRVGEPEDMAAAVSFLLSEDASYITGIQLPVDGGWLVR